MKAKLAIETTSQTVNDTTALVSENKTSKANEIFGDQRNFTGNLTVGNSEPNLLNVTRSGLNATADRNQSLDQNTTSLKPDLNVTTILNSNSVTTPLLNFTLNDSTTLNDLNITTKLNDLLTTNQSTNTTTAAATSTLSSQNRTDKGYSSNSECYFPFTYKVSFFLFELYFFNGFYIS